MKVTKVRYFMVPTPATIGAKVRTIGTNLARTIVLTPWRSKKCCALSTYSCLKNRESGRRKRERAHLLPEGVADLIAGDGRHKAADQDDGQAQGALSGEQSGGEQEGVSGEEEPDEKSRFGEDDQEQADRAEGDQ